MSHGKIREDKTCLNCGHVVEERFCPHCGQENVEPKQPFHYLFTHFIEDFTHYDGQFWKTIKYLLFRPGKLTKEYLAGKRQLYVAPVKLYIFISFITFFLPSLFSGSEEEMNNDSKKTHASQEIEKEKKKEQIAQFTDSLTQGLKEAQLKAKKPKTSKDLKLTQVNGNDIETDVIDETADGKIGVLGAKTMKQFDSISHKNNNKAVYSYFRPFAKKIFYLQEKGLSQDEIFDRFTNTFLHTLPKALFIYLPVFAFFLWLFHNKKRWWYFDHGIFTLHYFSFLLLGTLIFILLSEVMALLPDFGMFTLLSIFIYFVATIYMCIYFFIAHHSVYETRKRTSIFKGSILFLINSFGVLIMFLILLYVSFMTMH